MKRPDPHRSTESWVSIWLGCMDAPVRHSRGASAGQGEGPTDCANFTRKRLGCILHQDTCGEGYNPEDNCAISAYVAKRIGPAYHIRNNTFTSSTTLGATPTERRVAYILESIRRRR